MDDGAPPNELGNRIRAARGYAEMSQTELADRLGFSLSTFQRIELGQRGLRPWELRAIIEGIAEATRLPAEFFTADLAQLQPGYVPPEDRLDRLEKCLADVLEALHETAAVGQRQLKESASAMRSIEKRLATLERQGFTPSKRGR